ncbi:D-alanyl-D-alanine carboxypeptidase family protein [Methylobacter sp. YRD-M1]|uniref:D-alanyl-D-alanine carboxypeptidase family protein n=1 Tax=Methylobacter sp. YRD-M1 TaxID=2911520 RepID=UPI00227BE5E6|nr:serine hydrolase [Methylobacter sp. YRD-M1]WAK00634.1 serine hydrolase [Methylobacter sp. YRD-M1]
MKFIRLILLPFLLFFVSEISYGRHSAIVIDADNGSILHEVEANQPWFPASLTKVMTLYMTFDALKEGQISLHDTLTASWHAARQPNSRLGLRQGEKLTVRDAILAVITRSANDAAVVLGEELGGTEENFGAMMTAKARSLGMSSTRFMNATGLPNDLQVTTSRDLAILAWRIQRDFPVYYQFFSAQSFDYKGTALRSINAFVKNYPGAEGMKTGFTCGSGYNLMASAHQNGQRLIGVVLGGMTSKERYQLMTQIMDDSFAKRFSDNPSRDIYSIPADSFSPPPYQLGCGSHRATSNPLAQGDNISRHMGHATLPRKIHHVKRANKVKHTIKAAHTSKTKSATQTRKASRTKSATKAKSATKTKPAAKTKTAVKTKSASKIKKTNS